MERVEAQLASVSPEAASLLGLLGVEEATPEHAHHTDERPQPHADERPAP